MNPSCRGGFLLIGLLALLAFDASPAHARWPSSDFGCLTLTPGGLFNQVGVQDACSDGSGGTYVLWYAGAPVLTAYLQHLDAFGDECFLGGALALASNTQPMCVAPDGMGGVVVLSQVWPSGSSDVEVALQRFESTGQPLWTTTMWTGASLGYLGALALVPDASGASETALLVDASQSPTRIRAQRVNAAGQSLWANGGVVVAERPSELRLGPLAADPTGRTWVSFFEVSSSNVVRAQLVDADGAPAWSLDGALVDSSPYARRPWQMTPDGAGGAWISWQTSGAPDGSDRLQRIRSDGSFALGAGGLALPGTFGTIRQFPALASAPDAQTFVSWHEQVDSQSWATHFDVLDTTGTMLLPGTGTGLGTSASSGYKTRIIPNTDGGATVTLLLDSTPWAMLSAQRLAANGTPMWSSPAPILSITDPYEQCPSCDLLTEVPDGSGGVTYFQTLADSGQGLGHFGGSAWVRAQHVDGYGRHGDTAPRIESLRDWPNDQGGSLELRWHASALEGDASMPIQHYDLVRVDPGGAGGPVLTQVATVQTSGDTEYVAQVPTLADSTSPLSPKSMFRVRAVDAASRTWLSPADSASSFSNSGALAVGSPGALLLALAAPRPNPTRTSAQIHYTLPIAAPASLELIDLMGRRVRMLASGWQSAGEHEASVSMNERGASLAPGLYFIRLEVPRYVLVQRLVVLR